MARGKVGEGRENSKFEIRKSKEVRLTPSMKSEKCASRAKSFEFLISNFEFKSPPPPSAYTAPRPCNVKTHRYKPEACASSRWTAAPKTRVKSSASRRATMGKALSRSWMGQ